MAYNKNTQEYTNEDYFNYVMSQKYSEAIEMLSWIGHTYNIKTNTSHGFVKGMTVYAGIIKGLNEQLIEAGLTFKIK